MKFKIYLMPLLFFLSFLTQGHSKENPYEDFKSLNNKGTRTLVHIHADWCPTCIRQKRVLKELDQNQFELVEFNFDKDKKFLSKYNITQQSMFISFANGKEVKRIFGISKKEEIMNFINESFNTSLNDKLQEKKSQSKIPNDTRQIMEQATQKLRDLGFIEKATKKNDRFIDFSLPNIHNQQVRISDLLKKGPVILTFYRGGWCPYCNLQLRAYQEKLAEFEKHGAQLIAISPESMESAQTTVDKNEVKFEILTDKLNQVARQYGLVFKLDSELKDIYLKFGLDLKKNQGNDLWELPIPATYVIDQTGKIRFSFLNVDYVQRAEPEDIIKTLKSI